jgi:hypothetical protein
MARFGQDNGSGMAAGSRGGRGVSDDGILPGIIDWADGYQDGVTTMEAQRAAQVRAGFLEELVEDPRVYRRLPALLEQVREYYEAGKRLSGEAADAFLTPGVQLVHEELRLDWPWVVAALYRTVDVMLRCGIEAPRKALPEPGETVLVTANDAAFETKGGLLYDENIERLREALAQMEQHKAQAIAPDDARGQAPRAAESYRAWGKWFYAVRVKRPAASINGLATADRKDRRTVRAGIAKAERLLSLGRHKF